MPPRRSRDDDTIIVRGDGDEEWAAPSSPESIGSDIDFVPKNKMAIDTPQNLESPEPEQADGASITSASSAAKQTSTTKPKYLNQISFRDPGSSTMEERLQMMPAKRPLPWRDGVEAGSELETGGDSRRKQIRFGCLLATRGNEVENPCHSCANGRGKFELCIALPGFFKGACASCQLSGRPNRCSIKTNEDIEPEEFLPEDGIRSSPAAEESSSGSRGASGSGSRKNTVKETPDRSTSTTHAQEEMHSGPPAKRARVEEPEKLPQTGWQEPPVVDTGLGSAKSRGGRPPRSSLNHVATSWAHVNSPHMATRNSSTPINTRNGGSRRSVGQTPSADKETTLKEPSRKPSNTPSTNTPQSAPSRPASNGWASVNQTQQGSQPTFPNLAKPQIPKPQHQQAKPEQPQAKPEQQQVKLPQEQYQAQQQQQVKLPQEQYQAQQQQQVKPPQEQYQAQQQQQVKPPQEQYQAQQHQQHQQHQVQQQQQHQVQQQQQQQYQPPPPPPPPLPQAQPQHGRPQPQFQVQPNTVPPNAFGGFVDQQNGRMSNGLTTSQPAKKVKQLPPYQPTFVTTPSGLSFASAPLIETLPKRKQLQLMGIISGLQGGIDNIQRELNQLKKTLGIEDDDN